WHGRRFTLVEALSRPYRLDIELLTDAAEVDIDALLGSSCQFSVERDSGGRSLYGVVEQVVELGVAHDRHRFRLEVVPAFGLRGQAMDTRFFQDMTVPEIVELVLSGPLAGFARDLRMDVDAEAYEKREYC